MMYGEKRNSRACMLNEINEVSFAVNDLSLYLDTHPCDEKALKCFEEMSSRRNALLKEFAENFGPLTIDTAIDGCTETWKWTEQPFPWEKEGACR